MHDRSSLEAPPSTLTGVLALVVGFAVGACFDGSQALGLPCNGDRDCGLGQRCIQNVCGGPSGATTGDPDTEGTDHGTTDPSATSVTATDSEPSTGTDTGETSCGNGRLDADEECDPPSGPTPCRIEDCKIPRCGDNVKDQVIGEECDDGDDDDWDDCTTSCTRPVFLDRMDDPIASMIQGGEWERDVEEEGCFDGPPPEGWTVDMFDELWRSGYADDSSQFVLRTREIELPVVDNPSGAPARRLELRFQHTYAFDGCDGPGGVEFRDGATLEIEVAGQPPIELPFEYPEMILPADTFCSNAPECPNPLAGRMGFTGVQPMTSVAVDLDDYQGENVRLTFRVGFDCANCSATTSKGWSIDDVIVAPFCVDAGCPLP